MAQITRRAALGASALFAMPALAQPRFPERPIRLIIPWAAGGPADIGFRIMADHASRSLGQPVVVENRGGASGILGAMALQEARPDGHTISQMHVGVVRQMLLNPRPPYDPINDLTYILQITGFVMGLVVRAIPPGRALNNSSATRVPIRASSISARLALAPHSIWWWKNRLSARLELDACALSRHIRYAARAAGRGD